MHQTPVQIASVTLDLDATEALEARIAAARESGAELVGRGAMPGGMEFAHPSSPKAGCRTPSSPTSHPTSRSSSTT